MSERELCPENGVSPVIGVMLMIVVTIIIAAVVSAFAGGLSGEQKKVPVAQFDLRYYIGLPDEAEDAGDSTFTVGNISYDYGAGAGLQQFLVIMKSGEPLPTKDLKLVTYVTDANGTLRVHEYTGGASSTGEEGLFWDNPAQNGQATEESVYNVWGYGSSIIHPGEVYRTNRNEATNNVLGDGTTDVLSLGDTFEVNIVHIPTNEIIYHQVVTVQ